MIIPHLAQLGSAGLNQNLEARVIEIRPQASKKVPFSVLESATVEAPALFILKKIVTTGRLRIPLLHLPGEMD